MKICTQKELLRLQKIEAAATVLLNEYLANRKKPEYWFVTCITADVHGRAAFRRSKDIVAQSWMKLHDLVESGK